MKIYSAAVICILIAAFAHAEDDWHSKCKSIAELGESIMKARQAGASMAKVMEVPGASILEDIIILAYDSPRYSTDEMQKRSIEEFRDKLYLECVKASRPK